jgi:hypothetical protein
MANTYTDVRLYDPFLRPDWRFERVLRLISRVPTPGRTTKRDDQHIKAARSFMLRWNRGEEWREALLDDDPGLYYAYSIYDNLHTDPEVKFMLEARLLSNQDVGEIADRLKTMPETVSWYERLFFNVSPFLQHHDWIVKHVLLPSSDRFVEHEDDDDDNNAPAPRGTPLVVRPHLDMTLKFFAYFGGPILCDFMISGFRRGNVIHSGDEISNWLDDQWRVALQRRSAQAAGVFEVNRYNVMELFATHSRIIELQKNVESGDERRSTFARHVSTMLSQLPWTVGRKGAEEYAGSAVGELDEGAAEIDDEELILIGSGEVPSSVKGLDSLSIESRVDTEVGNEKSN